MRILLYIRVRIARRAADFDTGSARSVYVEGTRSHIEGHVSTPAGRLSASYILAGKTHTDTPLAYAQFADGLHVSSFHVVHNLRFNT